MKAVILAGGRGERLRPMTCGRPKPLTDFMSGKVLDAVVGMLKNNNVESGIITSMYMSDMLADYAANCKIMPLECVKEQTQLGTAGAVGNCAYMLRDTFIVVSGDCICDFDLTDAITLHNASKAQATMVLINAENPTDFGVVSIDGSGKVTGFTEKPSWSGVISPYCNAGIYILEPTVFRYIPSDKPCDFSLDVFPAMLKDGATVCGCPLTGYWCDIGDSDKYRGAHFDALDGKCRLFKAGVGNNVYIAPEVKLVPPVYIGDGTVITGNSVIGSHTVIGKNCNINNCRISGSILWDGVNADQSDVTDSVICSDTRLMEGARVGAGCVVGENCRIGRFASVDSGCGLWKGTTVADETSITCDCRRPARVNRPDAYAMRSTSDIEPERVLLLARALGSEYKKVAIMYDGSPIAQAMAHISAGGVSLSGGNAVVCGHGSMGQARFAVGKTQANAGMYISCERNGLAINLLDENGIELSRRKTGRITRDMLASRLEFGSGDISAVSISKHYYSYLLDTVSVRAQGKSIALCGNKTAMRYAADALKQTGWNPIWAENEDVSSVITKNQCMFGIYVTPQFTVGGLYDQNGNKISYEQYIFLRSVLCFEAGAQGVILPCDCSKECYTALKKYGIVQYCDENGAPAVAEATLMFNGDGKYSAIILDAVVFSLFLCKFLSVKRKFLSQCVENLPFSFVSAARCPNHQKGRVMQKIREKKMKVRVIPDDSLAVLKVYASALSQEYARELALDATAVINEIVMHGQS